MSLSTNLDEKILLEVNNLKKYFPVYSGIFYKKTSDIKAVDDVSFFVKKGETLGLVGESGCGKSTLGKTIMGLYDLTDGSINKNSKIQMIFQDPYSSLNPRMTVSQILSEPLEIRRIPKVQIKNKINEIIKLIGFREEALNRYPHEFSGGQRQRIGIARALMLEPELIIADEPVSALDVSIQAQIINLMCELQKTLGVAFIFISHDLSVVEYISDRVAVMYLGKIVELTDKKTLFTNPIHPYTKILLDSVLKISDKKDFTFVNKTEITSSNNDDLCKFYPRCPYANKDCCNVMLKNISKESNPHFVACNNIKIY